MMATFSVPRNRFWASALAYTALLQQVYTDFGFKDIIYKVATRPAQAHWLGRQSGTRPRQP